MSDDLLIRRESPDQPQVVALLGTLDAYLASLYAPEHNHILDAVALRAPDLSFFAAWQGGEAVGCAALRRVPAEHATGGAPYGEIKRMVVRADRRGLGVGWRLLAALEAEAQAAGLSCTLLETGRDQAEALRLYTRGGYVRRAAFGGYPDNGLSVFMERRLAS